MKILIASEHHYCLDIGCIEMANDSEHYFRHTRQSPNKRQSTYKSNAHLIIPKEYTALLRDLKDDDTVPLSLQCYILFHISQGNGSVRSGTETAENTGLAGSIESSKPS